MGLSNAERQRRYVARLKERAAAPPASVPAFNPETQIIVDREAFDAMRDRLERALVSIEVLQQDRDRWYNDCLKAEAELQVEHQHHTNTMKDKIVLKQRLADLSRRPKPGQKDRPS
jgi:hypothetical protein